KVSSELDIDDRSRSRRIIDDRQSAFRRFRSDGVCRRTELVITVPCHIITGFPCPGEAVLLGSRERNERMNSGLRLPFDDGIRSGSQNIPELDLRRWRRDRRSAVFGIWME